MAWVAKASAILALGATLLEGVLVALGQLFLAVALVALAFALGLGSGHARAGLAAAVLAFLLSLVTVAVEVLSLGRAAAAAPGVSIAYGGATLATLVALVALGVVARARLPPSPWRWVPLALGLGTIPVLMLGGALSTLHPRLLETSILVLGFGHLALAGTLAAAREA